ncbi:hypothetical protein HOD24_04310 [Candidatus Peregrinibacteria bacterium]|nr:hypothetical protein [Candidatus Peregrinibacteria bacterium]
MKLKNLSINLGLLTITTFLFFGGIEIVLRVTGLQTVKPNPPMIYQVSEDERISYELIPNISRKAYRQTVTTNSLGFRSAELDEEKETVLILGDSIAFGYGVKDNETIAANLAEQIPEYNWLNTAAPGYNLNVQTAIYETKLKQIDPAMLMLVFHYNDFDPETGWLDEMGIIRAKSWVPTETQCNPVEKGILKFVPAKCWLDVNSAFYKAMKKMVNMRNSIKQLEDARGKETSVTNRISDEQIEIYLDQLDSLVEILPEGIPLTFVIWPDRFMHSNSKPTLILEVEKRGFKVIDLYETFGNNVEVLGWDTVHPSAKAVKEAVDVIAPRLVF